MKNRILIYSSFAFSIVSLGVIIFMSCKLYPSNEKLDFDYQGIIVAVLSILVTILIGYKIYDGMYLQRKLDEMQLIKDEIKREIGDIRKDLQKEVGGIFHRMSGATTNILEVIMDTLSPEVIEKINSNYNYTIADMCYSLAFEVELNSYLNFYESGDKNGIQASCNDLFSIMSKVENKKYGCEYLYYEMELISDMSTKVNAIGSKEKKRILYFIYHYCKSREQRSIELLQVETIRQ